MNTFNQNHSGSGDNVMNFGPQPRKLNQDLKNQLKELIKDNSAVDITAVLGDGEAFGFASEIKNYLKEEGHDVNGVNQAVFSGPVIGQIIEPPKNENGSYKVIIGNNK